MSRMKGDITTDPMDNENIWDYYVIYASTFDNLNEMDKFLKKTNRKTDTKWIRKSEYSFIY